MNKTNTLLYEMLSERSAEELDVLLKRELHKDPVDEETVRTILSILRERDIDEPIAVSEGLAQTWEKRRKDVAKLSGTYRRRIPICILRAASVCIVVVLLFSLIPTNAQADNLWDRIARWTDEIFEFFDPHGKEAVQEEYVFQTDHPGLQQVYDAVVEMGITEPVVPMWLPAQYRLVESKKEQKPYGEKCYAVFKDGNQEIVLYISVHNAVETIQYQKDMADVKLLECQGNEIYIFSNKEMLTATWIKERIECCITADCQEDILHKVLKSIYGVEDIV